MIDLELEADAYEEEQKCMRDEQVDPMVELYEGMRTQFLEEELKSRKQTSSHADWVKSRPFFWRWK